MALVARGEFSIVIAGLGVGERRARQRRARVVVDEIEMSDDFSADMVVDAADDTANADNDDNDDDNEFQEFGLSPTNPVQAFQEFGLSPVQ